MRSTRSLIEIFAIEIPTVSLQSSNTVTSRLHQFTSRQSRITKTAKCPLSIATIMQVVTIFYSIIIISLVKPIICYWIYENIQKIQHIYVLITLFVFTDIGLVYGSVHGETFVISCACRK